MVEEGSGSGASVEDLNEKITELGAKAVEVLIAEGGICHSRTFEKRGSEI